MTRRRFQEGVEPEGCVECGRLHPGACPSFPPDPPPDFPEPPSCPSCCGLGYTYAKVPGSEEGGEATHCDECDGTGVPP